MQELKLVFPTLDMKDRALEYRQEWFDNGVLEINGDAGFDEAESYEEWIEKINEDLTRDDGRYVPSIEYFAVVNDEIVGTIQIRKKLNEFLLNFGGHIGYGVRPSARRKGYAAQMLALALRKCKELGLKRVLVTCDNDNEGSRRTILRNGGIMENELLDANNKIKQRYWIDISE